MSDLSANDLEYLANVKPSARQYAWQQLEFYGFIHFGMNTMTGAEWGTGHEDPGLFDPDAVDADGWAKSARDAGMRGLILTAKHHDGFCLWPSRLTSHSVAASPWQGGAGDVVRDMSQACARHGLRFGVYLSPWDRHEPVYGSGRPYDDFFVGQLTELLTGYGDIFCVWLDGANGSADGRHQEYDWGRYHRTIRSLQPQAVISVCGPDVRWCGNEAGHSRAAEWSVVPRALRDAERTASRSQRADDGAFSRLERSDDGDLGSRAALREAIAGPLAGQAVWYPAEVDTSIRTGWFHRPGKDHSVRTSAELFDIYCDAVGGNSALLLNIPPTRQGAIDEPDRLSLAGLGRHVSDLRAAAIDDTTLAYSSVGELADGGPAVSLECGGRWSPAPTDARPWLECDLRRPQPVGGVALREDIRVGQRIEQVVVRGWDGHEWLELARAECVGHQRLWRFEARTLERVRVEFHSFRARPAITTAVVLAAGFDVPSNAL